MYMYVYYMSGDNRKVLLSLPIVTCPALGTLPIVTWHIIHIHVHEVRMPDWAIGWLCWPRRLCTYVGCQNATMHTREVPFHSDTLHTISSIVIFWPLHKIRGAFPFWHPALLYSDFLHTIEVPFHSDTLHTNSSIVVFWFPTYKRGAFSFLHPTYKQQHCCILTSYVQERRVSILTPYTWSAALLYSDFLHTIRGAFPFWHPTNNQQRCYILTSYIQ